MRDISSIKDRLKDSQPQIHSQREKNIISVRLDEISKDPIIKETKILSAMRQKFKVNIQAKQKELNSLVDTITRNRQLASDEIEKVLKESRAKASKLISEAEAIKYEADNLLKEQINRKEKLDELEQEVTKRETDNSSKEVYIKQMIQKATKQEETTQKNLLLSEKHYQEALDCYISAVSLLTLAVDHLENMAKIRKEVSEVIYQKLEKIGIIEKRVITLIKLIDGDKLLLQQKAIELQDKEKLLKDRRQQLERVDKELKQKWQTYSDQHLHMGKAT